MRSVPAIIAALLVICLNLPAQDSSYTHEFELTGDLYFNSDAITNQFFGAVLNGNYIDNPMKDRVRRRLGYINRWGFDMKTELNWNYHPGKLFGKKDLGCSASLKDRMHADGIFSRDFFETAMYGNKMFAGENADLGNFRLNYLAYQQLQFGLSWEPDSAKYSCGIALSFLKGERNMTVDVKRADLFTSADARFIDLDVFIRARQTDTARTGPAAFNGYGFSADLIYEVQYVTWYNEGVLSVQLQDLGYIRWSKNSLSHSLDTFLHFEGVVIDDLTDLQQSAFPDTDPDSLFNNSFSWSREPYVTFLPAILSINATTYYGKKFIVEKGINYRFLANARPYYYGAFFWNASKHLTLGCNISYGGYGKFNAGLEAEIKFARRYKLNLNSFYLAGMLLPQDLGGLGASVSLSGKF